MSTTHTMAGAVTGVGAVTQGVPVNWTVFGQVALAWLVTIPAAALAAARAFAITQLGSHLLAGATLAILGLGLAVALWIGPQRTLRSREVEGAETGGRLWI